MLYEINLKKLSKLIGDNFDWEDNGIYSRGKIDLNDKNLKTNLNEGIVGEEEWASVEENILRKAAQLIINNPTQRVMININLGDADGIPNKIFKDWNSVAQYMASKYQEQEKIICNIEGKEEVVKALIGKISTPISFDEKKAIQFKMSNPKISWDISKETLVQSWGDKDYALNQIKKTNGDDLEKIFKLVPLEFWKNKNFIKEIFVHKSTMFIGLMPREVMNDKEVKEIFIDCICENNKLLSGEWYSYQNLLNNVQKNIYETMRKLKMDMDNIPNSTSILTNMGLINKDKLSEEEKEELWIAEKLYDKLFSNKAKCIEILIHPELSSKRIENLFAPHIQLDEEIIELMSANCNSNSYSKGVLYKLVPKEYFTDEEKTMNFLIKHVDACFNTYKAEMPEYIKKHFDKSEENTLKLMEAMSQSNYCRDKYAEIYINLSPELQQSERILFKIIDLKNTTFSTLDDNVLSKAHKEMIKNDKKIQDYILNVGNYQLFSNLDDKIIYQVTDKKHIVELVKVNYRLLEKGVAPESWREDIDIVSAVGQNIRWLNLSKTEIKKMVSNTDTAKKLISYCYEEIVPKLPKEIKANSEIGLYVIALINNKGNLKYQNEEYIPHSLWINQKFCINALKQVNSSEEILKNIPKAYFKDSDFIMKLFKEIDDGKINIRILNGIPEVKKCLDSFGIEQGNLVSFAERFFGQQKLNDNLVIKEEKQSRKLKI